MELGKYIIIEGGEGCGKSTQAKLLHEYLTELNIPCILSREPGGVKESEEIRKILLNKESNLSPITELFLFEAARAEFFRKKLIPSLEKFISVIADRSGYSTEAYQGYAGGIDLSLIKKLNNEATFGIKPDLAFIIDVHPTIGLKNEKDADRFASKGLGYHTKVNQGYVEIAKNNPDVCIVIPYREEDIGGIQEEIRKITLERLYKTKKIF